MKHLKFKHLAEVKQDDGFPLVKNKNIKKPLCLYLNH